jgi:hypothetical protein
MTPDDFRRWIGKRVRVTIFIGGKLARRTEGVANEIDGKTGITRDRMFEPIPVDQIGEIREPPLRWYSG